MKEEKYALGHWPICQKKTKKKRVFTFIFEKNYWGGGIIFCLVPSRL